MVENKGIKRFKDFIESQNIKVLFPDVFPNDPIEFIEEVYWNIDYVTYLQIGREWRIRINDIISTINWHKIFEEYLLENNIYSQFCDGMFGIKYSYADFIYDFYPPEYLNMYNIDHTYYIDWRKKALNLINNV